MYTRKFLSIAKFTIANNPVDEFFFFFSFLLFISSFFFVILFSDKTMGGVSLEISFYQLSTFKNQSMNNGDLRGPKRSSEAKFFTLR